MERRQELRGDVKKEAIDIYDYIDKKELKESYLATYTTAEHLTERGRRFQVREVCADFGELRDFQVVCWREDVTDERFA